MTKTQNPCCAILMATFNGARFLEQQLDSLAAQSHKNWQLFVSDDTSSDDTRLILQHFMHSYSHKVAPVLQGPGRGFAQNFLHLLGHIPKHCSFAAFCDQDDEWAPEKLSRAIAMLGQDGPALYAGSRIICNAKMQPHRSSYPQQMPSFQNALVQNIASGNTVVLNRAAINLFQNLLPCTSEVLFHDWWAYQCVTGAGGTIVFDTKPQVFYRQHDRNVIGSNRGIVPLLTRIAQVATGAHQHQMDQQMRCLERCAHRFTPQNRAILAHFNKGRKAGLRTRLKSLHQSGAHRQNWPGTLSLWGAAAWGKL